MPGKAVYLTIMPTAVHRIDSFVDALNDGMDAYEINTPLRQAAFLANVAVESGELRYVREIWGPTPAQARYEGRLDLGNTQPGDGKLYMGRGLIQVTGRANYARCANELNIPCVEHPEMLELPQYAVASAGAYWTRHGLNELADRGAFKEIVKIVNGGYTAWSQRQAYYEKAKAVL